MPAYRINNNQTSPWTQAASQWQNPSKQANILMLRKPYLTELEGLRGLAALWVLLYHVGGLAGVQLFFIRSGGLGVDLFILLSGFLMVHQYEQRRASQPWSSPRTIGHFYLRRFFRIAPLYYLLLIASFLGTPFLETCVHYITQHSSVFIVGIKDTSWTNLFLHLSFVFGVLPRYSARSVIPDWTISLEMQFYLIFPLMMLVVLRFGRFGYAVVTGFTLLLIVAVNLGLSPFTSSFPMASFLPLKMHLFLLGMLISAAFHKSVRHGPVLLAVLFLPLLPLAEKVHRFHLSWILTDILMAAMLFALTCGGDRAEVALSPLKKSLNAWPTQRLGDMSYSVYLVHILLIVPVAALLLHSPWVASLSAIPRYLLFAAAAMLAVFPVAFALYLFVERPGISLGKRLLQHRTQAVVA